MRGPTQLPTESIVVWRSSPWATAAASYRTEATLPRLGWQGSQQATTAATRAISHGMAAIATAGAEAEDGVCTGRAAAAATAEAEAEAAAATLQGDRHTEARGAGILGPVVGGALRSGGVAAGAGVGGAAEEAGAQARNGRARVGAFCVMGAAHRAAKVRYTMFIKKTT